MRLIVGVFSVAALMMAGACTYRLGDFTTLSTKNVPVRYDASTTVHGSDCKVVNFLLIPLGFPSLEEAVDRAVGSRGNALVNQVTYTSVYTFILGTIQCVRVKGDVVTLH
jgi:hypothetical protein